MTHGHIRSPDYATAVRGPLLTDARITRYMLSGHYGPAAQRRAELERAIRKAPRQKKESAVSLALRALL